MTSSHKTDLNSDKKLVGSAKKWTPLHHEVWRVLQKNLPAQAKKAKFLVCVSGGADSMALYHILKDLPLKLEVFHAHHGPGNNLKFRDEAKTFVADNCKQDKIPFHVVKSQTELKSENDFRKFRINALKEYSHKHPDTVIVMAHHFQDLLETRLMRLIRGTGPQVLQSMKIWKGPVFRPFLATDAKDLRKFLKSKKLEWQEDPSNQDTHYFRNWMRYRWLPVLEKARPGSLHRLADSLENLSQTGADKKLILNKTVTRSHYLTLNQKDQLQHLAVLLKNQGLSHFTSGQLKEVQKQLDNLQGRLTFKGAGALWTVNAQRISVQPL